ncbi:MAG: hypothetical protein LBB61_06410 [Treponema sp.]|nr:hypothetical protein [Treponema sp.]
MSRAEPRPAPSPRAKSEKKAPLIHAEGAFIRNNVQNNDAMTGSRTAAPASYKVEWNLPEDKLSEIQTPHTGVKALREPRRTASRTKPAGEK